MHTHSKRIQHTEGQRDSSAPAPAPASTGNSCEWLPATCPWLCGLPLSLGDALRVCHSSCLPPPWHVCAVCLGCLRPTRISSADPGTVPADGGGWPVSTPLARVRPRDSEAHPASRPRCPHKRIWKRKFLQEELPGGKAPTCRMVIATATRPAKGANPAARPHHHPLPRPPTPSSVRSPRPWPGWRPRSFRPLSPGKCQCHAGFCSIGFRPRALAGRLCRSECRPEGTTVGSGPVRARPRSTQ